MTLLKCLLAWLEEPARLQRRLDRIAQQQQELLRLIEPIPIDRRRHPFG